MGAPFDFFGLGQPGNGPVQNQEVEQEENQGQGQQNHNQQQDGPLVQPEDNEGWALWPQPQQQQE
jgi:hypothetical protein